MPATIKDISREAGVSIATVSKVLNGNYSKVSLKTRDRILDTARRLKYRPNLFARSLVTQRAPILGVLLAGADTPEAVFPLVAALDTAGAQGFLCVVLHTAAQADAAAAGVQRLISSLAQGIAILGNIPDPAPALQAAADYDVPCMAVARPEEMQTLLTQVRNL